ncbi:hypothetical protein WME94_35255 [Sorangium sp. So ce429]
MSKPNLSIAVEPFEAGKVTYLPMTASSAALKARGRVMLRVDISSHESMAIHVKAVDVSFPGTSIPCHEPQRVPDRV